MHQPKSIRNKSTGSRQRPPKTSNLLTEGSEGGKERVASPSPYSHSHHLLDMIPLAPSTTLAMSNKFTITNFSNNILNKIELEPRIIQPSPKPFKVRPSKHYKLTKSYLNTSNEFNNKSFGPHEPGNNSEIIGSSGAQNYVKFRADRRESASQQKPRESFKANILPSCTGTKRASTSVNYSPRNQPGLDGSILKPRNSIIKPSPISDQQKIVTRAALKYFSAIEGINSVQNARKSANSNVRPTKESIKATEMTHLFRGKIHNLIRRKADPAPVINLRSWTRVGQSKEYSIDGIHNMAYNF